MSASPETSVKVKCSSPYRHTVNARSTTDGLGYGDAELGVVLSQRGEGSWVQIELSPAHRAPLSVSNGRDVRVVATDRQ